MGVGRIGADHHDDIGMLDRVEILRAGRGAEGGRQTIAGRRMADPGAGVDIVVAKTGADQLLHQVGFFVGATRGGDATDSVAAILPLNAAEFAAANENASSHDTSRQGSSIRSRIMGFKMRSLWVV
jgi:hypothetical protein